MKNIREKNKSIAWEDEMSRVSSRLRELTRRERRALGMLRLKGCPRCKGDVILELDQWGWYWQCIQCGYLRDLQDIVSVEPQRAQGRRTLVREILRELEKWLKNRQEC